MARGRKRRLMRKERLLRAKTTAAQAEAANTDDIEKGVEKDPEHALYILCESPTNNYQKVEIPTSIKKRSQLLFNYIDQHYPDLKAFLEIGKRLELWTKKGRQNQYTTCWGYKDGDRVVEVSTFPVQLNLNYHPLIWNRIEISIIWKVIKLGEKGLITEDTRLPRYMPDGSSNRFVLLFCRVKNKLRYQVAMSQTFEKPTAYFKCSWVIDLLYLKRTGKQSNQKVLRKAARFLKGREFEIPMGFHTRSGKPWITVAPPGRPKWHIYVERVSGSTDKPKDQTFKKYLGMHLKVLKVTVGANGHAITERDL